MILAVAAAGLLIGFDKAGVAGTLGPFVTVLLALTISAEDAIGLLLPMLIVADAFAIATYWRRWDTVVLIPLLLAGVGGIVVGSLVISSVSEAVLQNIIAIAMLGYVAFYVWSRRLVLSPETVRPYAWPAGAMSGLTSTLAHLGGPPIIAYLMARRPDPRAFVATAAALFAAFNILKIPGYVYAGLLDLDLIASTAWAWTLIPVGVVLGRMMIDRINRTWFERVTLGLLAAGALMLLVT